MLATLGSQVPPPPCKRVWEGSGVMYLRVRLPVGEGQVRVGVVGVVQMVCRPMHPLPNPPHRVEGCSPSTVHPSHAAVGGSGAAHCWSLGAKHGWGLTPLGGFFPSPLLLTKWNEGIIPKCDSHLLLVSHDYSPTPNILLPLCTETSQTRTSCWTPMEWLRSVTWGSPG